MGNFNSSGSFPANLTPSNDRGVLFDGNFIDFSGLDQWTQELMPDIYEKEAEAYGDRSIGAFLKLVGAELPLSSDQVIWNEQGRLHTRYSGVVYAGAAKDRDQTTSVNIASDINPGTGMYFNIPAQDVLADNIQARDGSTSNCVFRKGQTVMIAVESDKRGTGTVIKGIVTDVDPIVDGSDLAGFAIDPYETVESSVGAAGDTYTAVAYGSEFSKGSGNFDEGLEPQVSTYTNQPVILKETYTIAGSDAAQISWIEISGADGGPSGYLWYLKGNHETKVRWNNTLEMSMVEGIFRGGTASNFDDLDQYGGSLHSGIKPNGTEGLFAALESRGNVYEGFGDEAQGGGSLVDFDNVLKQLDKNGSIQENMLYLNRDLSLEIDDILAQQSGANNFGGGGASFGVFNNAKDMALNLGFSGYRRGSYDFYKTDWRYLNDWSTRGGFDNIEGVLVPAGTSKVYDGNEGGSVRRPMLHVRYRQSSADNRLNKTWITGSVGMAKTSDIDELKVNYLSERCLVTQAANNYVLFKA